MARRATSLTKERKTRQKAQPDLIAEQAPAPAPRRRRQSKLPDVQVAQPSLADAFFPGGDQASTEHAGPARDPEPSDAPAGDLAGAAAEASPGKARRGRPPKVRAAPEPTPGADETADLVESAGLAAAEASNAEAPPEPPPAKARRAQKPETSSAPQPAAPAGSGETANAGQSGDAPPAAAPTAARWDPVTSTATFEWPVIEQVAATKGPNQAMARLLLAARAEGANSRWPF